MCLVMKKSKRKSHRQPPACNRSRSLPISLATNRTHRPEQIHLARTALNSQRADPLVTSPRTHLPPSPPVVEQHGHLTGQFPSPASSHYIVLSTDATPGDPSSSADLAPPGYPSAESASRVASAGGRTCSGLQYFPPILQIEDYCTSSIAPDLILHCNFACKFHCLSSTCCHLCDP